MIGLAAGKKNCGPRVLKGPEKQKVEFPVQRVSNSGVSSKLACKIPQQYHSD
jgi:hypothetical protein